jgi:predicted dehydrogenase
MGWPVRVGFLGAGFIAAYHSKSLHSAQKAGLDVVWAGAFDPDTTKLLAFCQASGAPALASEDEVIAASDAVYVCTWTAEHPRLVAKVAAAGKALFCEKPLAVDLAAAQALVADVETAGITSQVGLVLRHSPAFHLAKQLIGAPESGRVMSVVFRDDQYIPIQGQYASDWRADPAKAGSGTLLEHSIHDLDLLEWLLGPLQAVNARSASFHGIEGIEDTMVVTLAWPGGAVGTLTSIWHDVLARPSLRRVEIFCERALVVVEQDWLGPVTWTTDAGSGVLEGDALVEAAGFEPPLGENPDAAFTTAVAEGRAASPDVAEALRAHVLADAVYRSAAEDGAPVSVAP